MKLLVISVSSWVAGLGAYLWALSAFWGQRISSGDFPAVLFWSALASGVAIVVGYAPAMFALRARVSSRGNAAWWIYPTVGIGLGVLPVVFIVGMWSPNTGRALLSPEAALFCCMFAVFGAAFGIGFFLAYGRGSE